MTKLFSLIKKVGAHGDSYWCLTPLSAILSFIGGVTAIL
jgi:hypothetical protein